MTFRPITDGELRELGKRIDSEFVWAPNLEELYRKLNTHHRREDGWVLPRGPAWCGDVLVAFVMRPRTE